MARVSVEMRDAMMTEFRQRVFARMDFVPFPHQAEWILAGDGWLLGDGSPAEGEPRYEVRMPDMSTEWRAITPRPGGRARVLADLGAYKAGKSKGGGMWATGFAAIPEARVSLVGLEYDICAPEFEYIVEALLSEQGMNLKYDSLQNRPRDGRMWLDLPNGARYEAKSWERKDTLKGKEIDAYLFCEAYMLPGIECYTSVAQNLRARKGYGLFATTPDRPWVGAFHDRGHGLLPDWHCTCSVPSSVNPFTFDQGAMDRDDPSKGGLMTREKFAIAYQGKLGDYVGRVYNYQRGDTAHVFGLRTHPALFKDGATSATLANLKLPEGWVVIGAADTGAFMSGVFIAFSPEGEAFVLAEVPNYRYVGGEPEVDPQSSIPSWAGTMELAMAAWNVRSLWADSNSQFKRELANNHGITLRGSPANLETRTEVAREYLQARKVWLAPWLDVLPFELEAAEWPDAGSVTGRFQRLKRYDHTLDCFEHVLAQRPRGKRPAPKRPLLWVEEFAGRLLRDRRRGDPHLGRQ
jgi:hypothetical protein